MTILRTTRHYDGQETEIFVKYDQYNNEVREIKAVNIKTHGHTYPIGNYMFAIPEYKDAIDKIVDATNWLEIYRQTNGENEIDNYLDMVPAPPSLSPALANAFNNYPIIRGTL